MDYTILLWPHANARYRTESARLALAELEMLLRLAREKRGDEEQEAMYGLLELCSRMRAGMAKIKESVRSISASLTRRVRQISLLIKLGLSTK